MTHAHNRATDPDMTRWFRFLRWWKEYGTHLLTLAALIVSALLWFASQTGFAIIGPKEAVAQVATDGTVKNLEQDVALDSLRRTDDSVRKVLSYLVRTSEAGNRVVCYRDRPAAEVAGILCPSGKVTP